MELDSGPQSVVVWEAAWRGCRDSMAEQSKPCLCPARPLRGTDGERNRNSVGAEAQKQTMNVGVVVEPALAPSRRPNQRAP